MKNPNFIIGGVAAGGTSFLASIMVQHPQIYLPKKMQPEPHYFYKSWEHNKGLQYYLNRWFANVPNKSIAIGERSSSYLFGGKNVAKNIFKIYPDMRFIFNLRNPVERTWANYRFTVLQGLEDLSFTQALENEQNRVEQQSGIWSEIQPHNYTGRGFYANQLKKYLNFFPRKNILCIKSELLSTQTDIELKKIYQFLDLTLLDPKFEKPPNYSAVNVVDSKLQMELRQYFGDRFPEIVQGIRKEENLERFVSNGDDEEKIILLSENLTSKKELMPDTARLYLNELFSKDLAKLGQLVDFDIQDWK